MVKFRAWDKENREMLEVHGISFDVQGIWTNEMIDDESDGNFIFLSDIELSQSTGLRDKNGVEIFEGDIVNIHEFIDVGGIEGYEEGEREMIGIVRYGGIFNSPIPEWYLENSDDYISFSYMDLHDESFEVLGNIYEHPHLLEGDTE